MPNTIRDRFASIVLRIESAALRCGRSPKDVRLVAVSKTQPAEAVADVAAAGATIVGENYIQEARTKFEALQHLEVSWHYIGHLQSNKAKYAVRMFDLIHTVDTLKLAAEIDKQAQKAGKVQQVLVQVNVSGEQSKSGANTESAVTLVEAVSRLNNIRVCGLMTMPPFYDNPERARPHFATLRKLRDRIDAGRLPNVTMKELSMGMTGDFETAIEEGATLVRIGTALFGERL
jgi:pyridoxal phosphate enzyme (YggS family)